jgi:hypothetical protein
MAQEANIISYDGSQPTEVVESQQAADQEALEIGEMLEEGQRRSEFYAGKFKSIEQLEQGYLELQSKLGNPSSTPEPTPPQEETGPPSVADKLAQAYESYNSDKKFDVKEFEDVSKEELLTALFENSSQDTTALNDSQVGEIQNRVGGEEQYAAMMQWAVESLPAADVETFDKIIDSGNMNSIAMAVDAVAKRFADANGQEGSMLTGRTAPDAPRGYRSQSELLADMNDPRYDTDPAYRNDVLLKLENSPNVNF